MFLLCGDRAIFSETIINLRSALGISGTPTIDSLADPSLNVTANAKDAAHLELSVTTAMMKIKMKPTTTSAGNAASDHQPTKTTICMKFSKPGK